MDIDVNIEVIRSEAARLRKAIEQLEPYSNDFIKKTAKSLDDFSSSFISKMQTGLENMTTKAPKLLEKITDYCDALETVADSFEEIDNEICNKISEKGE